MEQGIENIKNWLLNLQEDEAEELATQLYEQGLVDPEEV